MNDRELLLAFNDIDDVYLQQAGVAGGHFAAKRRKQAPRILVRVLLAAAILAALSATAFGAERLLGIWNDRWLHTPSPDPLAVVEEAVSRQAEKDYTLSVTLEEVREDEAETARVLAGDADSQLARMNGDPAQLAVKDPGEVTAVYARYTVAYDHTKTFYRDGTLYQYFYLVKNGDGAWEIFDSTDPREVTVPPAPEDAAPETARPTTPLPEADQQAAEAAATAMVLKWADFEDVETVTVDRAEYSPAQTEAAIARLRGAVLAEGNGWTEAFLRENLAAVELTWTTAYVSDPPLLPGGQVTETGTYWLLRDPDTGAWENSEITGIMAP